MDTNSDHFIPCSLARGGNDETIIIVIKTGLQQISMYMKAAYSDVGYIRIKGGNDNFLFKNLGILNDGKRG